MENRESWDVRSLVLIEGQGIDEEALTMVTRGYWTRVVGSVTTGASVVLEVSAVSSSNWNKVLEELRKATGVESVLTLTLQTYAGL
jgi:hypothetical protein